MSTETTTADTGATAQNTAPELATTTAPATPDSGTTQQPANDAATPDSGDDADKSLKRLQRRVDRVTAARYQAEAQAQQAEARARQLEEELTRYRQPAQTQDDQPHHDVERLADERARTLVKQRETAEQSGRIRSEAEKLAGSPEAFSDVLQTVITEAGPLADPRTGEWTPLGEAITEADKPGELLVYLGRNPEIAETLHGLTGVRLQRAVVRIEAQMQAKAPPPPKPLTPVKPSGASLGASSQSMTDAEWYAARRGRK